MFNTELIAISNSVLKISELGERFEIIEIKTYLVNKLPI